MNLQIRNWIIFSLFLMICSSCASHHAKYKFGLKNKKIVAPNPANITHQVYLVGDAGNAPKAESTPLLQHLKSQFEHAMENTTILWLGDNIYPNGLAPKEDDAYALGAHRINKQLETLEKYKGSVYFIPGNHDWYKYGQEGVQRQEAFIELGLSQQEIHTARKQKNYFLPDGGCGDPNYVEITDKIGVIIADSQWYLNDYKEADNSHCNAKDKLEFNIQLKELYSNHQDKTIITAIHHPLHTYGKHGGRNTLNDHIFPLRKVNKNLWIPAPILGSALILGRTKSTYQDANHPDNIQYKKLFQEAMGKVKGNIIASGHEHSIQFIQRDDNYYIVSGAASKKEPVGMGKGSLFSAGELGYVKLSFLKNGKAFAECYIQDKKTNRIEVLFSYYMDLQKK